uniref:UDP-N-acetylglucosamine transferase subunit ALG13 n=1 Tax=Albugo laibachii Nc14 TaxID=890382 RepID=F0W806_9STRA|nr:UDPNacetylglucosamine transferase subunit putative [Albugo laibachii Nc14]|eukprot:CCA17259.1 UDPNacetylglucosamine transferase subunit putative [Albugo laibachii Nc14]
MKVFVTVGTTKFDALIRVLDQKECLRALYGHGYREITMQIGHGTYVPRGTLEDASDLKISYYRHNPHYKQDLVKADLVISHAGAGSCMDTLSEKKKLIVVVNTALMNNHQAELADAMDEKRYCVKTTCEELPVTLKEGRWKSDLEPYPSPNLDAFPALMDALMGV